MTVATVALSALPVTVDFTAGASATYGTNARKTSGGAIPAQGQWAGVTFNGQVKYTGSGNDRDPILVNVGSTTPGRPRMRTPGRGRRRTTGGSQLP